MLILCTCFVVVGILLSYLI